MLIAVSAHPPLGFIESSVDALPHPLPVAVEDDHPFDSLLVTFEASVQASPQPPLLIVSALGVSVHDEPASPQPEDEEFQPDMDEDGGAPDPADNESPPPPLPPPAFEESICDISMHLWKFNLREEKEHVLWD